MKLRYASALALFLCLAAFLPAAGPAPPDTPQGARMKALLAAFESGTPAAIRTFVENNFSKGALAEVPVEKRVERLSGMAAEIGPLEFAKVLHGDGAEVEFLARAKKSGDWLEVGMMLDAAAGFSVRGLRFEQSEGPEAPADMPASRKASDAEAAAAAETFLAQETQAGRFSGVVLMAKNGKPFFHRAYGLADRSLAVKNAPDTKFNLGSINKTFTQTAIAQLAEKGKLSLSDTIRKHLPDSTLPAADRITIEQLLTMTSGLGDFFGPKFQATPKAKLRTLAAYLPLFAGEPLRFEPGQGRGYSNAGYVVLGLIIEKVTGQTYYDYVRENVYRPAGMTDTDSYMQDAVVANRAVGYTNEDDSEKPLAQPRVNVYALPARGSSAGGGYSTAEDLLRFDMAMRAGKLLSPAWTHWYYTGTLPPSGAAVPKPSGGKGVAGGTAGVNAVLEMDVDTGYTVVVLANLDPPAAEKIAKTLRQWLGLR